MLILENNKSVINNKKKDKNLFKKILFKLFFLDYFNIIGKWLRLNLKYILFIWLTFNSFLIASYGLQLKWTNFLPLNS